MPAGSIAVTFAASCGSHFFFVAIGGVVSPPVVVPPVGVPPVVVPPVVVPPVVVPPVVVPPVVVPSVVVAPLAVAVGQVIALTLKCETSSEWYSSPDPIGCTEVPATSM